MRGAVGCIASAWTAFVTGPMWLAILFGILQCVHESVPQWLWVLYWAYVPCYVIGVALSMVWRAMEQAK